MIYRSLRAPSGRRIVGATQTLVQAVDVSGKTFRPDASGRAWFRDWAKDRTVPIKAVAVYLDEDGVPWLARDLALSGSVEAEWCALRFAEAVRRGDLAEAVGWASR